MVTTNLKYFCAVHVYTRKDDLSKDYSNTKKGGGGVATQFSELILTQTFHISSNLRYNSFYFISDIFFTVRQKF